MSEWWTYYPKSFLLFSPRTYYRLFELYNAAVWPAQALTLALGLAILILWLHGPVWRGRAIAAILAALWLLVAWAYLLEQYDSINWAARYFATGFGLQALLLAWSGLVRDRLAPRPAGELASRAGLGLFLFALVLQPLIGPLLLARPWAQVELFGIAPDPTVVATLGIALAAGRPWLLIIPALWCAISGATLATMGSPDWLVMPAAAGLALILTGWKRVRIGAG